MLLTLWCLWWRGNVAVSAAAVVGAGAVDLNVVLGAHELPLVGAQPQVFRALVVVVFVDRRVHERLGELVEVCFLGRTQRQWRVERRRRRRQPAVARRPHCFEVWYV